MESAVDRKQVVGGLLGKANNYRTFAQWVGDWETAQRILALAEQRARTLARPNEQRIRKRVKSGKKMAGCRDEEFWFQAEQEFRGAGDLAKESCEEI
jgi:hypothetical protein